MPRRPSILRRVLRPLLTAAVLLLTVLLCIEGMAYLTWRLSGADDVDLAAIRSIPAPDRNPSECKGLHRVAEWPADRGRDFHEAPMLAARTAAGQLPPVAERLPADPLVIVPPEQIGPYGGTWVRFADGLIDISAVLYGRITYEGLVRWGPAARDILPNLAERWETGDGGRSYTFWLRKGVRWSDGEPFTADDIQFWYEHVLKNADLTPVVPRHFKQNDTVMAFEKLDDYTVRFSFPEPQGLFLKQMASGGSYEMALYPAHYLKRFHPDFRDAAELKAEAEAAGFDLWHRLFLDRCEWRNADIPRLWAWVLKQEPPARPIVCERNPYYWKVDPEGNQLPYIDRIHFHLFDEETIQLKLMNGEATVQTRHVLPDNYPLFMEHRNNPRRPYRVLHWIRGFASWRGIFVNQNHPDPVLRRIFNERDFRIALSHAMNRDEINEVRFKGMGEPYQVAPIPASPYYVKEAAKAHIEYDPAKANRLLDGLGLERRDAEGIRLRPDGAPMKLTLLSMDNGQTESLLSDYWRDVGLDVDVKLVLRPLMTATVRSKRFDIAFWWVGDDMVPLLDPRTYFPCGDASFHALSYAVWYTSDGKRGDVPTEDMQKCMEIFRKIERTVDDDEQIRLFKEIVKLNAKNLWVIGTVGELPTIFLAATNVRNVPEVGVTNWTFRSPGNAAPECWAIEPR
jgi:peptide/nickel transport system substrate-binding protein